MHDEHHHQQAAQENHRARRLTLIALRPAALLRYRTHLLYWAACFGMTKAVRALMASRGDGMKFLAQRIAGTPDLNTRNRADSIDSVDGDGNGGNDLSPGTYYFVVDFTSTCGNSQDGSARGELQLIRE